MQLVKIKKMLEIAKNMMIQYVNTTNMAMLIP